MRYFILEKTNKRFQGDKVLDIAKKAAKYLFQNQKNNNKSITFCIRETTKGSKNKSYKYKAVLNDNSKINIKKYMGGIPDDELYNIGDIVTLYDRRANGYLTYNKEKYTYKPMYGLKTKTPDGNGFLDYSSVYYSDYLISENNFSKISYWKIIDKIKFQTIDSSYYDYIFQLENSVTPLFLELTERTNGPHKTFYFGLSSNKTFFNRFTIKNYMLGDFPFNNSSLREKFLIDIRHKIPPLKRMILRESIYNYKHL